MTPCLRIKDEHGLGDTGVLIRSVLQWSAFAVRGEKGQLLLGKGGFTRTRPPQNNDIEFVLDGFFEKSPM